MRPKVTVVGAGNVGATAAQRRAEVDAPALRRRVQPVHELVEPGTDKRPAGGGFVRAVRRRRPGPVGVDEQPVHQGDADHDDQAYTGQGKQGIQRR